MWSTCGAGFPPKLHPSRPFTQARIWQEGQWPIADKIPSSALEFEERKKELKYLPELLKTVWTQLQRLHEQNRSEFRTLTGQMQRELKHAPSPYSQDDVNQLRTTLPGQGMENQNWF